MSIAWCSVRFVGAEGRGAPVPEVDVAGRPTGFKTEGGSPVLSRPDPALLRRLAAEPETAKRIAQAGHAVYRERASEEVLGRRWREILEP